MVTFDVYWTSMIKEDIPNWNGQLPRGAKNTNMGINNIPTWNEQTHLDLQKERNIQVQINKLKRQRTRQRLKCGKEEEKKNGVGYVKTKIPPAAN